jgi:hypothetical protein
MVSLFIHIQIVDKIYYVLFSGLESQLREKFEQFFFNFLIVKLIELPIEFHQQTQKSTPHYQHA